MTMKILMLNNEFPPLGGGTGVVNLFFLEELARETGIYVDLVTSSRSKSRFEKVRFSERIYIYKVPVNNRNIHHSSNLELLRYSWKSIVVCRRLLKRNQYDLSFAFAGVPAGAISYVLRVLHGLPYIVSLQGPDVPGFEDRYNYLYPFIVPALRQIWRKAQVVTAISKEHRELAKKTLPSIRIPIIHNGVDTSLFRPVRRKSQSTEFNILCVGRLIERKGQHHLLRAFADLSNQHQAPLRLILAGTGDFEPKLHQLAHELGIAEHVQFLGCVPREEMPKVYQDADLFVLPSQNEGMSIALLEAMASALPVVVSQTGGTDELVIDSINGLVVEWADVGALAGAIERLAVNSNLRTQMGSLNREIALEYSWNEYMWRNIELMREGIQPQREEERFELGVL